MAEKSRYPQIPSTVWWGIRAILVRSPNITIDERLLSIELGVQETAAKAYINELKIINIISEEGKATPLAMRWRLDDSYADAVNDLISATYPEGLVHIAPPGNAERQKVVSWFQREGFGQGAAGNKAATYLLLSSPSPNEAPKTSTKSVAAENSNRTRPIRRQSNAVVTSVNDEKNNSHNENTSNKSQSSRSFEMTPLNINIQVHISADAGTEQIESIFQAMRRYLYDASNS